MKIKFLKESLHRIGLFSMCLLLFVGCNKEEAELLPENQYEIYLTSFESNFSCEYENINYDCVLEVNEDAAKSASIDDSPDVEGIVVPVMDGEKVIGRYIGLTDQSATIYIDMSDYMNSITIYDVNNPEIAITATMMYDSENKIYKPVLEKSLRKALCSASCAIGTVAIAASDGPVPVMDVLAASYAVTCLASCIAS